MRSLFLMPDEVLLQLYKRARYYLLATYLLLTFTVAYLCTNQLDGFICAVLLFILVHGGLWLSLRLNSNFNIITIPAGLILLYFIDLYSNKEAPFYIFCLMLFVYINLFVHLRLLRFIYLCVAIFISVQMVYPDMLMPDLLRIGVTYFVAAFSMYILVDYLKKVERDLAHKNSDLTEIFNCSPLPIMLLEINGSIKMINDSCLELLGFNRGELLYKSLHDVYYFATEEKVEDLLRYFKMAVDENKTIRIDDEYKKRNGELIAVNADIKPLELHGEKFILFVGQDVTRELKLRKEIQRTHKLYRTMAANIPNSTVYMFDRQLRFLLVEGDGTNKEGFNKSKIIGKSLTDAFTKEIATELSQYFKAALLGVESSVEINENGRHLLYYFLPVRAENNEIMSGIALSVNITELKQTKSEVNVKNNMINAYAEKASHVVRRPIANLLGLADILLNQEHTDEERNIIIKFIYDSIKELDENLKDAAVELNK